ncbi:MAG TPA: glycosyltransferase family 4 protein [Gemmataceae bacterium]|nr:glycosyltransferase family 4 protein [Gemmataceae bacterium]
MKIAYITAGAGGMFCGSCLHDNTLVAALIRQGHDALLIPTYTPIHTDEPDVSYKRVFLGGINVYLQEKLRLFRHTPWFVDRLFDTRPLLRWVSRFAVKTEAADLGDLTVSMLEGEHGHQSKEVAKLVSWLADEVKPEVVNLTNALLSGMIHELKGRLRVPVLCSLQGDDIFLESLRESHRSRCLALVRVHCREIDGFVATSAYYADFMAEYFHVPRSRIHVVHPGLNLAGHGGPRPEGQRPFTIGYFARICPEKGLHVLTEAFQLLKQTPGTEQCRLHVSGWLGAHHHTYFADIRQKLKQCGLDEHFLHVESPDHDSKVRFFHDIDVLSVPTTYREPKGLYVLEALANGVPVVQPRHGSFPELVEATGGGLLVQPEDPHDLARALRQLFDNPAHRDELGRKGKEAVHGRFHAERMAAETAAIYAQYIN